MNSPKQLKFIYNSKINTQGILQLYVWSGETLTPICLFLSAVLSFSFISSKKKFSCGIFSVVFFTFFVLNVDFTV